MNIELAVKLMHATHAQIQTLRFWKAQENDSARMAFLKLTHLMNARLVILNDELVRENWNSNV